MATIPIPSTPPYNWATNANTRDPDPLSSGRQQTGWVPGETIPGKGFNSLEGNQCDWITYLSQFAGGTQGILDALALNIRNDLPSGTVLGTLDFTGTVFRITAPAAATELRIAATGADPITLTAGNVSLSTAGNFAVGGTLGAFGAYLQDDPTTGLRYGYGVDRPGLVWDLSPNCGGWTATLDNYTDGGPFIVITVAGAATDGEARLLNKSSVNQEVRGHCPLRRALDNTEVIATYTDTVTALEVIFGATNTEQPTVELIRQTRDGTATESVMATCQPTAAMTRQTITDSTIANSGRLEWGTYRYFIRWKSTATINADAASRAVESVRLFVTPDAIY